MHGRGLRPLSLSSPSLNDNPPTSPGLVDTWVSPGSRGALATRQHYCRYYRDMFWSNPVVLLHDEYIHDDSMPFLSPISSWFTRASFPPTRLKKWHEDWIGSTRCREPPGGRITRFRIVQIRDCGGFKFTWYIHTTTLECSRYGETTKECQGTLL